MICEQVRESIELGNQTVVVSTHLSVCPACRQHEAETSSLLSLLSAQPRVKAPADFDVRLQARLASKEIKLMTLVNSLPAVEVPANFDFQLRGRLAQAKTGQEQAGLLTWVEQFFTQSFSLGQAASAMAAVALIAAVSVLQFNRSGHPNEVSPVTQTGVVAMSGLTQTPLGNDFHMVRPADNATRLAYSPANESKPHPVRRVSVVTNRASLAAPALEPKLIASTMNERVIINAKTRQEMKLTGNIAYGQQLAKFVPAPKAEPTAEVF